ncbi:hypothetical protein [Tengunoibacter tsumagoiensis]|uniref:Uncharacterized protein n=1 Tax=Tengunoibacter tsumagoiensis TaxID=2014871 RepID=A0A402A2D4_9CHLR|nr:hypothetical protein [Tengunoibacter tsumagoiensis]GCE13303.1 hypothetical protein KTT_31620 [Tengunoibacter tsumagoiensis]
MASTPVKKRSRTSGKHHSSQQFLVKPSSIPPRASAHPSAIVRVRPRSARFLFPEAEEDVTRIPTWPQSATWHYESPGFAAVSSLPSLSLIVAEAASHPDLTIDDVDTYPEQVSSALVEKKRRFALIDTLPLLHSSFQPRSERGLWMRQSLPISDEDRQSVTFFEFQVSGKRLVFSRWLDQLRWWLLRPGRLEYLFWLGGTMLLCCCTGIFFWLLFMCLGCGAL